MSKVLSIVFDLKKGTGQGGILSPQLWNFVMDTFLEIIEAHTAEVIAYADDGALIVTADDMDTAQHRMQIAIDKAQAWAEVVGLKFSIQKTKAMIFSRDKDPPSLSTPLIMAEEEIEIVGTFKYLGVLMDSRLDWGPHIDQKVIKAKIYLMMMHKGLGASWGLTPAITLWLYTGIIRPFLTYGSVVWARKTAQTRSANKLKKVQRLGMLLVAPMCQHSPTAGLEVILGVSPLNLYIQYLAARTCTRLSLKPNQWSGRNGNQLDHINWIEANTRNLPHKHLQDGCTEYRWNHQFATFIGDGMDTTHTSELLCYTDGSGQGTTIDAGMDAFKGNQKDTQVFTNSVYTGTATVFQAKLYAIQIKCDFAIHKNALQVMILSDCQAAIKAVYNSQIKSRTVLTTVDSLNSLAASGKEVLLYWVRGHNNMYGNKLADHLAKTGAAAPAIGSEPFLPLSLAICRQVHKAEFLQHWTDTWNRSIDYRQTKYFFPNPDNVKIYATTAEKGTRDPYTLHYGTLLLKLSSIPTTTWNQPHMSPLRHR
jgi:ribonuclease HI